MSAVFDASSVINNTTSGSHTTSGSNRFLIAFLFMLSGSGAPTVSSLSYNGVALTQKAARTRLITGSNYVGGEVWYLDDPASGSNTLSITYGGSYTKTVALILSYHTAAAIGTNAGSADGNSAAPSTTFTTGASLSLVIGAAMVRGGDTDPFTPGSGITERHDGETDSNASTGIGYTSGEKAASGGSDTYDVTATVGDHWICLAIELTEASSGVTVTPAAVTAVTAVIAPTVVLGSVVVGPDAVTAVTAVVAPTVVAGSVVVGPDAATAVTAVIAPTVVLGSVVVGPDAVTAVTTVVAPTVVVGGLIVAPDAVTAVVSTVDPTVVLGSLAVGPNAVTAVAVVVAPTVVAGSVVVGPVAVGAVVATVNPVVVIVGGDILLEAVVVYVPAGTVVVYVPRGSASMYVPAGGISIYG